MVMRKLYWLLIPVNHLFNIFLIIPGFIFHWSLNNTSSGRHTQAG